MIQKFVFFFNYLNHHYRILQDLLTFASICYFWFVTQKILCLTKKKGTEKYPDEMSYKQFLSQNGGYSNASTATEHTNFYFSVNAQHLEGALDRFSSFFTCPLFTESATSRELNAVHAEFKRNLQDDSRRLLQSFKHTANQEHPFTKFSTGNLETLGKHDINMLRRELLSLHKTYYAPERMKLVCYGKGTDSFWFFNRSCRIN